MPARCRLRIGLHVTGGLAPGTFALDEVRGGPGELLGWLEVALGLDHEPVSRAERIAAYSASLAASPGPTYRASIETDAWATARALLDTRDELRMAGWTGLAASSGSPTDLPPLVAELAAVEGVTPLPPGVPQRVDAVLAALERGQRLPPHQLELSEPLAQWPARWRPILAQLDAASADTPHPAGPADSALGQLQRALVAGMLGSATPDASFRWVSAGSRVAACHGIAAVLAAEWASAPERVTATTLYCADEESALLLDSALSQHGVPVVGVRSRSIAQPALQVLPLLLALAWEPVDPGRLLDLLTLPLKPVGAAVARRLADALIRQPGLGSRDWDAAVAALTTDDTVTPEIRQRRAKQIADWLHVERIPRGEPLPAATVLGLARRVARWAQGYAAFLERSADPDANALARATALRAAAGHAAAMGALLEGRAEPLREAQLQRLLDETRGSAGAVVPRYPEAGGPRWISSLADLDSPCERLVWLGLTGGDPSPLRWSRLELAALRRAGLDLDDGTRDLVSLRLAERRGLLRVRRQLLAVQFPRDEEARPHPLWIRLRAALQGADGEAPVRPVPIEHVLAERRPADDIAPWNVPAARVPVEPPPPPRPLWDVEPGALTRRGWSSATELESRLECPIRWVFHYQAGLREGRIARLPERHLLAGSFGHQVLERVFGGGGPLPDAEQAAQDAGAVFDERVGRDAAPLAQPGAIMARRELRSQLMASARAVVTALASGGYRIETMERDFEVTVPVAGEAQAIRGAIDCLAVAEDGREAVVDFKYGASARYRQLIEEGAAAQLATYVAVRRAEPGHGGGEVGAAYLILATAELWTPGEGPIPGAGGLPGAPSLDEVWRRFSDALEAGGGWMDGTEPVPARPLQRPSERPDGVERFLGRPPARGEPYKICRYCEYSALCGLKRLS